MKRLFLTIWMGCLLAELSAYADGVNQNDKLQQRAQAALLADSLHEALDAYSLAVSEAQEHRNGGRGVSGDLLAEYAYTLALHHDFEAALMNIDRARLVSAKYGDFYAAQILIVMGHEKAAKTLMTDAKVPQWISGSYQALTDRHKTQVIISTDASSATQKRANRLAANKQTIQSIALFEELLASHPQQYSIDVDYSTVWEQMGRLAYASELLQQGIDKMPQALRDGQKGQIFRNHKQTVDQKRMSYENASWFKKMIGQNPPKLMTYVGASMAKDIFALNGRLGLYTSNKFSASLNLGVSSYDNETISNIGLSAYKTFNIFVVGLGVNQQFAKDANVFSLAPSAGLSFLNKSQTSSFDLMLNGYVPFSSDQKFSYSISVGKTIYFDLNGILK